MFEGPGPRVFAQPPGADFPAALVAGLQARMAGRPPEAMAQVTLYLNTTRMRRAVRDVLAARGAAFLPRLRLVTDPVAGPPAVSPLRRRLELSQLILRLLEAQPDLAPRTALYDLSDSLVRLMDEMQDEGVSPDALAALDLSDHSAHWKRTQDFLGIIAPFFGASDPADQMTAQRRAVQALAAGWAVAPPPHPVIVAGSTGSRGTTALLMQAVAALPQGALVLPGFDFDMPEHVWSGMTDALTAEDHPQFRFRRLLDHLGLEPTAVRLWSEPAPRRAVDRLVSLSLRPAPVTDQWLTEGRSLPDLCQVTAHLTLVEAPGPRAEASAIALILRQAAEQGRSVALITPDRMLTRQVTATLDRWGIVPDDSAGTPLALSAPGRLLRHVAALFGRALTPEALLTLLKHPLTATGADRGNHLRLTRDLELRLRRSGPAFPDGAALRDWAGGQRDAAATGWADWIAAVIDGTGDVGTRPLQDHVAHHLALTERLARGAGGAGTGGLWLREAGQAAWDATQALAREAAHGGPLSPADYANLFAAVLAQDDVRDAVQGHPGVKILGPREARECRADLVILGGLNDGSWPGLPQPDPWLNRQMRKSAGLLLPERQIGLSAHDYQQAIAAKEVVLSRSMRSAEAETVPSRWINRLVNLMEGLPERSGPQALAAMKARGAAWLALAAAIDRPAAPVPAALRPAPRPPVAVRPRELPVTAIRTLIRDPYAIYARYILRLRPLDPLRPAPDALMRGSVLHAILERFVTGRGPETLAEARARLMFIADTVLAEQVPWPAARRLWHARLDRAADAFLLREAGSVGQPVLIETKGSITLPALDFCLTAKPDRIDEYPDGTLHILDYKTGTPPTAKEQKLFDKQLLLEAAMAERGAFETIGARRVARISYVGVNAAAKVESTEITPDLLARVWGDLHRLVGQYLSPGQGYASRRAVFKARVPGDYDHLARFGEWDMTDSPMPGDVG
ncbi:MAG: double-strand break repair protein AddB [Rhodobacter sp.]|nr:double-strand break repair protein AddB [Rhodobacter sp.]MCA3493468.1 double-strand break repair protein AddB [Rhodobacter sp.]MCA3499083.1 double-strand break repair protein AddB [Rhodobacter sp.]MCA3502702.1 double-strand break repair protein AddB [Rhodobacter sp.]MCA3516221.1 double-strand break repair protein AddB [Rhodobacter sp.]